jgi:hypothetical protein
MLTAVAAAVAFGLLAGFIAWQANAVTYSAYHTLVDDGSVSVDAALHARAAVLDHMGAAATYLATTGAPQQAALATARARWDDFNTESRISWRNLTDPTHGETNVYAAADRAASDYIQQIGAMYAYYAANDPKSAGTAFLAARETLNSRLVPALGGLEAVKVEDMEATYAGAAERINAWRTVLIGLAVVLAAILAFGLWTIRRMHYRWSWPVGGALLVTLLLAVWMQFALASAASDARVMVRDAYDNVAGTQDLVALLSQGRALESIAIFDPDHAATHFQSFDDYHLLVEQKLCGPPGCTRTSFTGDSESDFLDYQVVSTALNEQDKLGLPRAPLIANTHFDGQARGLERVRAAYQSWLADHATIQQQLAAQQIPAAAQTSVTQSDPAFLQLTQEADAVRAIARTQFDQIWQRVYAISLANQALALLFPLAGIVAAWGIWQRRRELFV